MIMMTTREKMIKWRESKRLSFNDISKLVGISGKLIAMIESGEVTHPKIVEKIKNFYEFSDNEVEELLPKNRRPSDPNYDPDKYVINISKLQAITMPKQDTIDKYLSDVYSREVKQHQKRSRSLY